MPTVIRFESDDATVSLSEWRVRTPVATLRATGPFRPGWYRVRLRLHTPDTPAVRKRFELEFDTSGEVETREWNERLSASLMVQLKQPASEFLLKLVQCTGVVRIERFRVKRIARAAVAVAAVREKLRLVSAYGCLRPVLWRGVGMVVRGQLRTLGRKLFKGIADSKVMRPEAYRASEADAAWWRADALPADAAARIRTECDALPNPEPVAVLLRVTAEDREYVRLAAESVRRQLYPHWELFVASDGVPVELGEWAATDERVTRLNCEPDLALPKALALGRSEQVVELPATAELAEDALYRFAVLNEPRPQGSRMGNGRWTTGRTERESAFAHSPLPIAHPDLFLTAELNGINGYDAVVFALLNGLPGQGFRLLRPPSVKVRDDLLPPPLRPSVRDRAPDDWQLIVFPPFALEKFSVDRRTVVYTMWETDELLPKWVRTLNRAARVIVPSRWGAECFRANGVTVPISVVPLGYDPSVYNPLLGGRGPSVCTFGTAGALAAGGMRKNAQHLIDLFRHAFPTEPDVRLRVKLSPTSPVIETHADPRIDVLRASLPHRDLADWYRSLTVYVNGSFGEGFGLHLIEAMACGKPLITPDATGLTEFFTPDCGYAVGGTPVPVRNDIYRGHWVQPSDDGIVAAMRRVRADRAEAEALGATAERRAVAFTWAKCCAGVAAVMEETWKHPDQTGGG